MCLAAQLCPTLYDPMDCSPPGSSVHGILWSRILEWVATPFCRGPSWPNDWTQAFCTAGLLHCGRIPDCLSYQGLSPNLQRGLVNKATPLCVKKQKMWHKVTGIHFLSMFPCKWLEIVTQCSWQLVFFPPAPSCATRFPGLQLSHQGLNPGHGNEVLVILTTRPHFSLFRPRNMKDEISLYLQ